MIKIEYGGSDILYVPVDDINLITRYGSDNPLIQLDRLGVATWKNRRERVRKRIKVAAEELLKIAAARKLRKASTFIPDQHFYDEFKNRFGFVETEDQANAISEVEDDLAKGSPMDRLICGDVGFGKTEVAMRAAAVVVSDNKNNSQIAIVAPTTLLCRQHYKNFIKRFEGTNIKVAQLSRLVTTSKAREIKEKIESGEVQIVIGTHALLQKTIKFKNLGLVIIDEEQHFGVAQKERLKELRSEVHVLTLSATPIPRTLQMSLTGVKDLSLISTPPIDRLAVRNFVMPYDSMIVREAIMREYNRGGKVFFVVPRVRDIEEIEPRLKILLPEIKITHAHGQMNPSELDKIMNEFVDGKIDMLLSTTIIESGIDISEANTMIIYKAEMFGLSQLYQLRGRVGRGKLRAYCYFMLDNRKKVSKDSQKKLEVMQNLDSLGVGFSVASHDMDIRGSGNILGDEQSGHIKETGVELYQQMLLETIEKLKNSPKSENTSAEITPEIDDFSTQVKLGISLLIPEDYMPDLSLRMSFYKKIANIKNDEDQESLNNEMTDRFGKIPSEIYNLMEISKLKFECKKLGIERIESNSQGTVISFKDNKFSNPEALMKMISESKGAFKIIAGQKILYLKLLSKVENSVEYKINSAFEVVKKISTIL
jgi:transcription-repair coupling factor (superfamily II helicase)